MRLIIDRSGLGDIRGRRPLGIYLYGGKGAGYIGGWTAYLVFGGYRVGGPRHLRRRVLVGFTRNGNAIPLISH